MKMRWTIWGVVLVGAGAAAVYGWLRLASAQTPGEAVELRPILATELPGTIEDNAAKAYRMLIWELARESAEIEPYTHKTTSAIKRDPAKYIAHADRIVEIAAMERVDWGVELSAEALVPHVSEMQALDAVLGAKSEALAAAGDGEALGRVLAARVRMAEHLAEGGTLIEWATAERYILNKALDQTEASIDLINSSDTGRKAHLTALHSVDADDPLGVKRAVESDMMIVATGLRDGFFADQSIMIGSGDAPKLKGRRARRIARLIDELRPRIISAMTIAGPSDLIIALQNKFDHESSGNGWVISDFAAIHDRAHALSERITDLREQLRSGAPTE